MSSICSRLKGIFSKLPKAPLSKAIDTIFTSQSSTSKQIPNPSPISAPSQIQELVRTFKKNSRSPDFRRRQYRYETLVRQLVASNHFSAIESILEHQKKYKDSMADEGFGVRLIVLYGKAAMFDHAYKVFDQMPQFDVTRTVTSFNALLYACVRAKKFDKIGELFRELPEKLGIQPNVISYNTVIKAFCQLNDFDSAMKVIEKMEESMIGPDTVSYNTMFEAYYKDNKLEEAEKLWQRMEEKGVIVNVRTYNAKLRGLIRNEQIKEALELIENMENGEVKPDSFTYNLGIKGCVSSGKLDEAKMLHGKMAGDCCLPNKTTYQMLIPFACGKGDIDFAFELCKQAVELKVFVFKKLMQLVVDALIEKSKVEEAKELVALVTSSGRHLTLKLPVTE